MKSPNKIAGESRAGNLRLMATVSALGFALGIVMVAPAFAEPEPEPKPPKPKEGLMPGLDSQATLASDTAVSSDGRTAQDGGTSSKTKAGAKLAKAKQAQDPLGKVNYTAIGVKGMGKVGGGATQVKGFKPPPK